MAQNVPRLTGKLSGGIEKLRIQVSCRLVEDGQGGDDAVVLWVGEFLGERLDDGFCTVDV